MNIKYGNLLEGDWDCIWHVTNTEVRFGAGIAYQINKRWPEVYKADVDYDRYQTNREDKLGTFSKAVLEDGRAVYNLYGQVGIGNDGSVLNRNCHYDHLYNAMYKACQNMCVFADDSNKINLGVPKLGCGLAGGHFIIVKAMLEDMENMFPINITVYDFDKPNIHEIMRAVKTVKLDNQIKYK